MNKMKKDKHIKVLFHLEQDEDGYPPFSIEGLWCKKASNDTYIVDNEIGRASCRERVSSPV